MKVSGVMGLVGLAILSGASASIILSVKHSKTNTDRLIADLSNALVLAF